MLENDRDVLRELAKRYAEIAALPVQEEKRRLWRKLNGLCPERPMVMIDQVCWSEFTDDSLMLRCIDPECQGYEVGLRRILYQWKNFPVDMVVDPFIKVYKAVYNSGVGITSVDQTLQVEGCRDVASHRYINQIQSMEDVEKIPMPVVTHDVAETKRRVELAHWLFDGIIDIREEGYERDVSIWDPISQMMGVENALYAIVDQPEMMHALAKKMSDGYLSMLTQLEDQGLLPHHQSLIHCTGAFTDELPADGFEISKPRTKDIWTWGQAQMFSTVSPAMFDEYEITYAIPIYERFGLVYYGCCDPLDRKMDQVRKIPHLRKVSMSPWADQERGAAEIGKSYVFSRKPNPAHVAMEEFDGELVKKEFADTLDICKRNGCAVEFILKDISTVRHHPERLNKWAEIAMKAVCG